MSEIIRIAELSPCNRALWKFLPRHISGGAGFKTPTRRRIMNSCESLPAFRCTNALNNLIMIFQAPHEGAEKERWPQNTDVNRDSESAENLESVLRRIMN